MKTETQPQAISLGRDNGPARPVMDSAQPTSADSAAGPAAPRTGDTTSLYRISNKRILVVDDNPAIHADFRKVLCGAIEPQPALLEAENAVFGKGAARPNSAQFELHSAQQGQEALEKIQQALAAGLPYALAFVDMRMPPGWDGIETVARLWQVCPDLQVVLCTAYSDYSWDELTAKLGTPNNLVILKKPFDNVEVFQLAHAFTRKWELNRQAQLKLGELSRMVARRTRELEAANRDLKREAEERLELERQIRHSQKMEAVGQLAAGVAHDFNNILTIIHGHASMLSMRLGAVGPHVRSLLEIRDSAERAANLIRQLLAFSRKQTMQFRSVELGEVITSISGMLGQLLGEHITLETKCAAGLPPIYADRGMIEQVIVNLTINARDAIRTEGRITIQSSTVLLEPRRIKAGANSRPGQFVCLTVSDTGCGIEPEALGHLFEPFFTTKEAGKGTGLGLATVYGIVKEHQGWIEVQSDVGAGAAFNLYFPVSDRAGQRVADLRIESPTRQGNETILLAEDDPTLRETVSDVLTLQGYRVLAVTSGPAALDVWRRESGRIDLLLADLVMPGGMRGTELAAELKRSNPQLKVIYTTGYSPGVADPNDPLEEGVNFLAKPYPPSRLAQLIRKRLDDPAD